MVKASRFTASCTFLLTTWRLESSAQIKSSARPSTSKEITLLSGTTIDLTFRLCGATGVITKLLLSGTLLARYN